MPNLTIRSVTTDEELAGLAGSWNSLLSSTRTKNPFLTHEWMSSWWEVFGEGLEMRVLVAEEDGRVVGIAPFYAETARVAPGIQIRQLSLMGDKEVGSDFLDLIVHRDREGDVIPAMMSYLCETPDWRRLSLRGVAEDSACRDLLGDHLSARGIRFCNCRAFRCPSMPLPATIDEFLEGTDNTYKLSARRRLRKLSRRPGFDCVLSLPEAELEKGLSDMFTLLGERWRSQGLPSVFDSPRLQSFYKKVSPRLHRQGWLELSVMKLEGSTVAALYGLMYEGTYSCLINACGLKGFEEKAGNAVMFARIDSLVGRAREFNFLRGDQPYKYQWGGRDRQTMNLCGYRGVERWIVPSLLPALRGAARRIKRLANSKRHGPTRRLKKKSGDPS